MEAKFPTELAERLDKIIQSKRLNSNELAKMLGVTSTTIYQILNGRTKQLSMELLTKLYQELDINMVWLTTGEGEMYIRNPQNGISPDNKPADNGAYGQEVLNEIRRLFEEELREKNQQLNAKDQQLVNKDRQLENKDRLLEGMQRTIDTLAGKFSDVTADDRHDDPKIIVHPAFARKSEEEVNDYQIA